MPPKGASKLVVVKTTTKKQTKGKRAPDPTFGQVLLRTGVRALYDKPGALAYAATNAYGMLDKYLGSSSAPLKTQAVSAPLTQGMVISRSGTPFVKEVRHDDQTISICGSQEVIKITADSSNYTAVNTQGNSVVLTETGATGTTGAFSLYMTLPGTTFSSFIDDGLPSFVTPDRLYNYNQMYGYWRFERLRFTFIPVRPTSEAGSVALAWTQARPSEMISSNASDIYGSNPFAVTNMSQMPYFAHGPHYSAPSIDVSPRSHGHCENPKDWCPMVLFNSNGGPFDTFDGAGPNTAGSLVVNFKGFSGLTASAYDLGFIKMDYVITYHAQEPRARQMSHYTSYLASPSNRDLFDELKDRYEEDRKVTGGDVHSLRRRLADRAKRLKTSEPVVVDKKKSS